VEIITYSLRDDQKRSDQFYEVLAIFTDELLARAERSLGSKVKDFQAFIRQTRREEVRTAPEYTFELLTLGVLWRVYGTEAVGLAETPLRVLNGLVRLRERVVWLKPPVDLLRGLLGALFLDAKYFHPKNGVAPSLVNLDKFLQWMAATGDFRDELKRLKQWRDFLASQVHGVLVEDLEAILAFARWFENRSLEVLGRYTPNVEQFLTETHPGYRFREDAFFCGRRRVEYHMNMVGTEIMNRAFQPQFAQTRRKVVLLPPCMKAKMNEGCEAVETPYGELCQACTPSCRVHQVTKLGEKKGFAVFVLPHELSVFSGGKMKVNNGNEVGVVGISCPLTNVTGGWETKDLGIPAQGVLLDYCGCSWHWDLDQGISTDINLKRLQQVIDGR